MKIFITGIAGFLGSHLADAFLAKGYEVAGIDNLLGGYHDNVPFGVEFHECDLLNFDKLKDMRLKDIDFNQLVKEKQKTLFKYKRFLNSILTSQTN